MDAFQWGILAVFLFCTIVTFGSLYLYNEKQKLDKHHHE
jgi:hypothetical protein